MTEKSPVNNAKVAKEQFQKCTAGEEIGLTKLESGTNKYHVVFDENGFNKAGFDREYSADFEAFWQDGNNIVCTVTLWGEYDV